METPAIIAKLKAALYSVAPEAEGEELENQTSLQDQLDLDSVDIMNYVMKVQEEFQVEIPNQEYKTFLTIDGATAYLQQKA